MTSLREWAERRPAFSVQLETVVSTFSNLQRSFVWQRWSDSSPNGGAFLWMGCDISGGVAEVYKYQFGTDTSAVLIWTSASAVTFDFCVSNNTCYFGNGTDMKKYDSSTVSKWGITAPAAGPSLSINSGSAITVYTSWCYCYTYYNSNTGHESSPSPISACTGTFTGASVAVTVVASTDPQVTNIRIYRTPDGGAQDPSLMQEITNSPFANSSTSHNDATLDINLSIRVAPEFLRNDPPTPSRGFVVYGSRIWGFANNTTYYSGFEEIANGVPEESWPSGLDGNYYPWAYQVTAHAPLIDGIAVFQPERISKVEGDSLDTFRRYTLLDKRGTRSLTSVASVGGSVAWLDTSNTIWVSDIGEIGLPIRPDIQSINPLTCWITVHISGTFHWVVVLDGANGILYVYDIDLKQWMPPWTLPSSASAMTSGETSVSGINLILALGTTQLFMLGIGTYADAGNVPYVPILKTNMYRLSPPNNPSWKGVHDWSEIKTAQQPPVKVEQLTDDDPELATFTDVTANGEPSPDITQGNYLQSWRYTSNNPTAQFMAMRFTWPESAANFHLYQMDEAFHPSGG